MRLSSSSRVLFAASCSVANLIAITCHAGDANSADSEASIASDGRSSASSQVPPAAASIAPDAPPSITEKAATRPATGLAFEARVPLGGGLVGMAGIPTIGMGYRGRNWGFTVGPYLQRYTQTTGYSYDANNSASETRSTTTQYGATALLEIPLVRPSPWSELHVFAGATLGGTKVKTTGSTDATMWAEPSGEAVFGGAAGVGARIWPIPRIGIGAELGLTVLDAPRMALGGDAAGVNGYHVDRDVSLSTVGTLSMAFVL